MPTYKQYELVKQQVNSFKHVLNLNTVFEVQPFLNSCAPKIVINDYYHFCDPDWNIVSKQLAKLYSTLKKREKCQNG